MGVETLAVAMVGMGLLEGITGYNTYQNQGTLLEAEGVRLEGESRREASRIEDEGRRFADRQKMAYIGSGVEIGGSAVVTLAQTDKWAAEEAQSVRDRGTALKDYHDRSAKIARNQGMASFISGVAGGLAKGYGVYSAGKMPAEYKGKVDTPIKSVNPYSGKSGYGSRASAYTSLRVK